MSAICGSPGLAFELSAQRGILPPHDMAEAYAFPGDIGLNSTVKLFGILSASIENHFHAAVGNIAHRALVVGNSFSGKPQALM